MRGKVDFVGPGAILIVKLAKVEFGTAVFCTLDVGHTHVVVLVQGSRRFQRLVKVLHVLFEIFELIEVDTFFLGHFFRQAFREPFLLFVFRLCFTC